MEDGINAAPKDILDNEDLIDGMEQILKNRLLNQYTTNIKKKVISKNPNSK